MKNKLIQTMNGRKIELSVYAATEFQLRKALELCHLKKNRIRIWYGDIKTGRAWNEEHGMQGYISNSTGEIACLILISNSRSTGGGAILDGSIVRIDDTRTKKTLYTHSNFHVDLKQVGLNAVDSENNVHACFESLEDLKKHIEFMKGERHKK